MTSKACGGRRGVLSGNLKPGDLTPGRTAGFGRTWACLCKGSLRVFLKSFSPLGGPRKDLGRGPQETVTREFWSFGRCSAP